VLADGVLQEAVTELGVGGRRVEAAVGEGAPEGGSLLHPWDCVHRYLSFVLKELFIEFSGDWAESDANSAAGRWKMGRIDGFCDTRRFPSMMPAQNY
jgi:hypothetical protein